MARTEAITVDGIRSRRGSSVLARPIFSLISAESGGDWWHYQLGAEIDMDEWIESGLIITTQGQMLEVT